MTRRAQLLIGAFAALPLFGCNRSGDADLREWKPTDHDNVGTENQAAPEANSRQSTGKDMGVAGIDEVVFAAWKQNCVTCHGAIGRGDGPQGRMVKAADLTRPDWHRTVSDTQIAAVITEGRGAMPGFKLPESTVAGLVRLIRLLDPEGRSADAGTAEAPNDDGGATKPETATPTGGGAKPEAADVRPASATGAARGQPSTAEPAAGVPPAASSAQGTSGSR